MKKKSQMAETIKMSELALPQFSWAEGYPSQARIYASHYYRLQAVLAAARSGNEILIRLAIAEHDKYLAGEGPR